ncbi:MAG: DUF5916 domain-containing protein, partial [Gammaproteobacteria bacterium]
PSEYAEPSERTQILLLYDADYLYIGARLFDAEPELITSRIMRQGEQVFDDDWFAVIVDPFHDQRSGYQFVTNPNGLRQEGLFRNVSDMEWEWQGIWTTASSVDEQGWVTEIAIPMKSISFDPAGDTWGINFRRAIARRDEEIGWVSRNRNTDPSISGVAVGFEGLQQGLGLDIVPSFSMRKEKSFEADESSSKAEPSLDVFYKLTPTVSTVLTINTDFSATEVDDRTVDLSRFSVFLPEKRDFFLQGSDIFEFGRLDQNGRPFFSRSIGLSDSGQPVDIEYGGKLTGRIGRFNIGALAIRQDEFAEVNAGNAVVARVSANILEESAVGMIATEGDPNSNSDNSVQGIDFAYRNTRIPGGRIFETYVWAQQSQTEGVAGHDKAYGFRVRSPNSTGVRGNIRFEHIEENFNPALGFVNRRGIDRYYLQSEYTYRPRGGNIRSLLWGVTIDRFELISGGLESQVSTFKLLDAQNQKGDILRVRHYRSREVLVEPFEISRDVIIPAGSYSFGESFFELATTAQRKVSGGLDVRSGEFYDGDHTEVGLSVAWRPSGRFFTSFSYRVNDVRLPYGDFATRLLQFRTEIVFSTKLSWVTLLQYDSVTETAGINSRLQWVPEAGREAFIVVDHNLEDYDQDGDFRSLNAEAAMKFSYTFRF